MLSTSAGANGPAKVQAAPYNSGYVIRRINSSPFRAKLWHTQVLLCAQNHDV